MQFQPSEPHVNVRIGDAGNHSSTLQIDDLGRRLPVREDFLVRPGRLNACARDGQSLHPWRFRIAGINVAVNQNRIAGKGPAGKDDCYCCTEDHPGSACKHESASSGYAWRKCTLTTFIASGDRSRLCRQGYYWFAGISRVRSTACANPFASAFSSRRTWEIEKASDRASFRQVQCSE